MPTSDAVVDGEAGGRPGQLPAVRGARRRRPRHELRAQMVEVRLARGQALFSEGEPGDRLYVVLERQDEARPHAPPTAARTCSPSWARRDVRRAVALRPRPAHRDRHRRHRHHACRGLGNADLQPWLTDHPEVAEQLLAALARRLRRTNEAMADLVFSDVPGRVAKALLDLATTLRRRGRGRPAGHARPHPGGAGPAGRRLPRDGQQGAGRLRRPRLPAARGPRRRHPRPRAPAPPRRLTRAA